MLNTTNKIIKHKVGLLNLAEQLGNVSKACKTMGLSRDTFYRYKAAVEEGGIDALLDQNRRKPNIKNRVDGDIEQAVVAKKHLVFFYQASENKQSTYLHWSYEDSSLLLLGF